MTEISLELPPGDPSPVDESHVEELAMAAARRALVELNNVEPDYRNRTVFQIHPKQSFTLLIRFPDYRSKQVWDRIAEVWHNEETRRLVDYLWDHGQFKMKLSRKDKPPDKKGWARIVFGELVHGVILQAAEEEGIEVAVDGAAPTAWDIPEEKLLKHVKEALRSQRENATGQRTVVGYCPLFGLKLPSAQPEKLPAGVTLSRWSERKRSLYMTRFQHEFLWHDFKKPSVMVDHVAEVDTLQERLPWPQESLAEDVANRLDLMKWSLCVAADLRTPPSEGSCLIVGPHGNRVTTLRRDSNHHGAGRVSQEDLVKCTKLMADFLQVSKHSRDFGRVLWHYGRAAVAGLARDVLLESAIGLDCLLVPGGGDSRYRFLFHGSVLLSDETDPTETRKLLTRIYGQRSAAAHGGDKSFDDSLAMESRYVLGKCLAAAVRLACSGQIPVQEKKHLSEAIQEYVFGRATKRDDAKP